MFVAPLSRPARRGRSLVAVFALLGTAVAAACGGGSSGGGSGGGDDSGMGDSSVGGDARSDSTTTDTGSATDSAGHADGTGSSSGGSSGSSSGASDASFAFDGFAHGDGWSDAAYCPDDDGDGWTTCGGDCNDHDSQVNPCAFDTNDPTDPVGTDGVDNDCDGKVDNLILCEPTAAAGTFDPTAVDYANAADLCDNPLCPRLVPNPQTSAPKAWWNGPSPANARRVTKHMGSHFAPKLGQVMALLSNGTAEDATDQATYATCPGTDFNTMFTNPMPLTAAQNTNPCGQGVNEATVPVHDYTELQMSVRVPINAGSYSFDFAFFSEEYPVYICQGFNDTFLAIQYSQQYPSGNQVSYDANGHRINVNNSFFQDCKPCADCVSGQSGVNVTCPNGITPLQGTFYEVPLGPSTAPPSACNQMWGSGGTDWLTTTSPVVPGETITLRWVVFDENDGILDSSVILDHFRWHSTTLGNPVTGR